jgi:hypothetical protein
MKTKMLLIIGVLIIAFAAVVAPVMAATNTTITGNPAKTISVTVNGGPISLVLNAGSTASDSTTESLTVASNSPGWTVSVKDALDGSKPSAGQMVDYSGGSYGTLALASHMSVGSASQTGFTGTTVVLSGTDQAIETGAGGYTAANTFTNTALTFSQPVAITDSVLPGSDVYRIIVTFTGNTP